MRNLTYEVFELLQLVVGENDSLQVGQALFEALPDAAEEQEEEKQVLFWQCGRLLRFCIKLVQSCLFASSSTE